jgi:hypothetical protein
MDRVNLDSITVAATSRYVSNDLAYKKFHVMKESFSLSWRFRMTIGVLLGTRPPMLAAIWFASFHAANIIRSPAKPNLELKADVLTESIWRWK